MEWKLKGYYTVPLFFFCRRLPLTFPCASRIIQNRWFNAGLSDGVIARLQYRHGCRVHVAGPKPIRYIYFSSGSSLSMLRSFIAVRGIGSAMVRLTISYFAETCRTSAAFGIFHHRNREDAIACHKSDRRVGRRVPSAHEGAYEDLITSLVVRRTGSMYFRTGLHVWSAKCPLWCFGLLSLWHETNTGRISGTIADNKKERTVARSFLLWLK